MNQLGMEYTRHMQDSTHMQGSDYDPKVNPYLDDRLRARKGGNLHSFIDDLNRLWTLAGKPGKIIRDTPFGEELNLPVIGFKTMSREADPHFKEYAPRLRHTMMHPYIQGEYVEIYGQMFSSVVQFRIYAETAEQADDILDEFEDFIEMYKGIFKLNGVQSITFRDQLADEVITAQRFTVAARPIQYNFRFEKITPVIIGQIERMTIDYHNLDSNIKEEDQNGN